MMLPVTATKVGKTPPKGSVLYRTELLLRLEQAGFEPATAASNVVLPGIRRDVACRVVATRSARRGP